MKKQRWDLCIALSLVILCVWASLASATTIPATPLAAGQESALVGAGSDACDFVGGFAVGLSVVSLFGCAICAGGAFVLGVGHFIMC